RGDRKGVRYRRRRVAICRRGAGRRGDDGGTESDADKDGGAHRCSGAGDAFIMLQSPTLPRPRHVSRPADHVTLVEVSPRDGLQNEQRLLSAVVKVELVDRLSAAGFPVIEVTSFVSPKAIPQLADAAEVMAGIRRASGV